MTSVATANAVGRAVAQLQVFVSHMAAAGLIYNVLFQRQFDAVMLLGWCCVGIEPDLPGRRVIPEIPVSKQILAPPLFDAARHPMVQDDISNVHIQGGVIGVCGRTGCPKIIFN